MGNVVMDFFNVKLQLSLHTGQFVFYVFINVSLYLLLEIIKTRNFLHNKLIVHEAYFLKIKTLSHGKSFCQ